MIGSRLKWEGQDVTDGEWLECTDPQAMLGFLGRNRSERKLRLFAVACCRCFHSSNDERFRQAVQVAEQYADGQTTKAALKRGRQAVRAARHELPANDVKVHGQWSVYWLAEVAASENAYGGVGEEMHRLAAQGILDLPIKTRASVCSLLRCIFGPSPSRPAPLDLATSRWISSTVVAVAQAIYDERAFNRLPILADALEDAGCNDTDIIAHLRGPGPHALGCWPLDLLLGKG